MIDREKVVKGLECCSVQSVDRDCDVCPIGFGEGCALKLKRDALALLKAQEPKLVKHTISTIRCPRCNKQITSRGAIHNEIKYCWKCGQAVKWEP